MFCESVNNIESRSMPNPQPPVGGNPYSRAVQNVSSKAIASSSPDCRSWNPNHTSLRKKKDNSFNNTLLETYAIPSVVPRNVVVVPQDHSIQCMHCKPERFKNKNNQHRQNPKSWKFINTKKYKINTSRLLTNNSKRSVRPGLDLCHFAKGLIISGWLMMKVGLTHNSSKKCPTSCMHRRAHQSQIMYFRNR